MLKNIHNSTDWCYIYFIYIFFKSARNLSLKVILQIKVKLRSHLPVTTPASSRYYQNWMIILIRYNDIFRVYDIG